MVNERKTDCKTNRQENRLLLTITGIISKNDLERLYTDVRFCVADLQPGFNVISDFSSCKFMYLNGLITFRKIINYILSNQSGEIVRVIDSKRIISKQIINLALIKPGYKPIYAGTREEAEVKINNICKRDGLRIELHQQPVEIYTNGTKSNGYLLNISTSGCAITSSTSQPIQGEHVQIKFKLNDKGPEGKFDLQVKVVRVESYTFAVQFSNLNSHQKALLWACLLERCQ